MKEKIVQTKPDPLVEAKPLVTDESINSSPFYKSGDSTLPNGAQVKPGGLYMMDDQSGVIFQLSNETSGDQDKDDDEIIVVPKKYTGTLDLSQRRLEIKGGKLGRAASYKRMGDDRRDPTPAEWLELHKMKIDDLTRSGRPVVASGTTDFTVYDDKTGTEIATVYNVLDTNGQLCVIHTITPEGEDDGKVTQTEVAGLVYVQVPKGVEGLDEDTVFVGFLEKVKMKFGDPKGAFREKK